MMRMPWKRAKLLSCLVPALAIGACGGGGDPPFTLRIQSVDVVLTAVERLEIVVSARPRRFVDPEGRFPLIEEGNDGVADLRLVNMNLDFVMGFDAAWVNSHMVETMVGPFAVEIPLFSVPDAFDSPPDEDPTLVGRVYRRGEQITDDMMSTGFLQYPLVPGGEQILRITCSDATRPQCQNNDPP